MDCGDLVSDLRRRIGSGENVHVLIADLEYGIEVELEDFARKLLALLIGTVERRPMSKTIDNGLGTSSQQAKKDFRFWLTANRLSPYQP